jgi:hypothetical protein
MELSKVIEYRGYELLVHLRDGCAENHDIFMVELVEDNKDITGLLSDDVLIEINGLV